jgi:hypothetical protein
MRVCIAALGLWLASAELKNPLRTEKKCRSWIKDAFQGRANVKVSRLPKLMNQYCLHSSPFASRPFEDKEAVCKEIAKNVTDALEGASTLAEITPEELCAPAGTLATKYPISNTKLKADPECVKMYTTAYRQGKFSETQDPLPHEVPVLIHNYCMAHMSFSSVTQTLDELCAGMVSKVKVRLKKIPPSERVSPALACSSAADLEAMFPERQKELADEAAALEERLRPARAASTDLKERAEKIVADVTLCATIDRKKIIGDLFAEVKASFADLGLDEPSPNDMAAYIDAEATRVEEACKAASKTTRKAFVQAALKEIKKHHPEL